jgi:hypothetical protein
MILKKIDRREWTAFICSGLVVGSCEYGNERLGSIKCWKFLDYLSNCWFLMKISLHEVCAVISEFL